METNDDAGVYRIDSDKALVQTVDFFTPITDDAYLFGQIAAANALSDIYAMGATALTAMNLVCFPLKTMDLSILKQTLRGGLDKIHEAGAVLVGGHSVQDPEFKYGLSVTGLVHPDHIITNRGARPGDALILTKPLGTGIIATAVKADSASTQLKEIAEISMATLNRKAAESMRSYDVHACTDITGFGLIGHLCEMISDSRTGAVIHAKELPIFEGVEELCNQGLLPGGLGRNRAYRNAQIDLDPNVPQYLQDIIHDPQTSGGLLIALPADQAFDLVQQLHAEAISSAAQIGSIIDKPEGVVLVRG